MSCDIWWWNQTCCSKGCYCASSDGASNWKFRWIFFPSYCDTKGIKKLNLKSNLPLVLNRRHTSEKHESILKPHRYFWLGWRPEHKAELRVLRLPLSSIGLFLLLHCGMAITLSYHSQRGGQQVCWMGGWMAILFTVPVFTQQGRGRLLLRGGFPQQQVFLVLDFEGSSWMV